MCSECFWKYTSVILGREAEQWWPLYYNGEHSDITACFTKNMLFELKKIKLQNKKHFVENKKEILEQVLKMK
jgi:hypothetical protein